ncbi:MAG: hypothetical protein R3C05_21450 [Pirellulaceae bacterium]
MFNRSEGVDALVDSGRLVLSRYAPDGTGPAVDVPLDGLVTPSGDKLTIDFGDDGIGGDRFSSVGNGHYVLTVDTTGDGNPNHTFAFHRLFGDADGDRDVDRDDIVKIVTSVVSQIIDGNIDGEGGVNLFDRTRKRSGNSTRGSRTIRQV